MRRIRRLYVPTKLSGRLWFIGLTVLLLGVSDVWCRAYEGMRAGAVGMMLHMGYEVECLVAGLAILTGGALLLDYVERRQAREEKK
ncbi:MAG: hypothetical protein E7661_09105 [Ruminococcaceae bacterium]|nr:hypothetical protein [Oscillospiraceae bacterium]